MFEIYSERGKGEKMLDLSPDGTDLNMQQSSIKGLQEVGKYFCTMFSYIFSSLYIYIYIHDE